MCAFSVEFDGYMITLRISECPRDFNYGSSHLSAHEDFTNQDITSILFGVCIRNYETKVP
jgi:hypothetical protein